MKKIIALTLIVMMVLTFASCIKVEVNTPDDGAEITDEIPTEFPETTEISGEGTEENPWQIGATENDHVTAAVYGDTMLVIEGEGTMKDFENEADRPWNSIIEDISDISIFGTENIGKNAFKNAGKNSEFGVSFYYDVAEVFGESCFEGANFGMFSTININDFVKEIGPHAFANTEGENEEIYIYCDSSAIAENAFENVSAKVYVYDNGTWAEENRSGFGGTLEYVDLYILAYDYIYDSDDISGNGMMYIPADMDIDFNAESEDSEFIRYELVSGTLDIADPENPQLNGYLVDDVKINIYCHYIGESLDW